MTHRTPATGAAAPVVPCRRLDAAFTVATHLECLYCAGDAAAVATGDHAAFCTFRPGVDPVCFGFPDALRDTLPTPRALPPPTPVVDRAEVVEPAETPAEVGGGTSWVTVMSPVPDRPL